MPSRALLLQNPRARRGAQGRDEVAERLRGAGLDLVTGGDEAPAEYPALIRRHAGGLDLVVVAGGDGSINAAVQGLVGPALPLGIVPMGTANNLARTLGIPFDLDGACEVIASGYRRGIDLGRVNDRYFCTTASLGLSVRITEELSSGAKRRLGPLAYVLAAARVLRRARPFRAEISGEGTTVPTRTVQVVVGNGRYYGAALAVAEDATIDDARLDLYSLEVGHWWELLKLAPALKRGTHGERPEVVMMRGTAFEVRTRIPMPIDVDGEVGARTPARFRVAPKALEVFVPPKLWG